MILVVFIIQICMIIWFKNSLCFMIIFFIVYKQILLLPCHFKLIIIAKMNIKIDWLILDYYHGCYVPWQQEKASRQLPAKKVI